MNLHTWCLGVIRQPVTWCIRIVHVVQLPLEKVLRRLSLTTTTTPTSGTSSVWSCWCLTPWPRKSRSSSSRCRCCCPRSTRRITQSRDKGGISLSSWGEGVPHVASSDSSAHPSSSLSESSKSMSSRFRGDIQHPSRDHIADLFPQKHRENVS